MRDTDREQFEQFVTATRPRLLRAAYLLTGDGHLAEDLVQATLEKVALRWRRLDAQPEAYARQVLVSTRIDWWRRRRARADEVLSADATEGAPALQDADTEAVEARRVLLPALAQLPHRQRAVIVLRYLLDLPEAEVAAALSVSVGTVKSTTSRGLAHLRQLLPAGALDAPTERTTS